MKSGNLLKILIPLEQVVECFSGETKTLSSLIKALSTKKTLNLLSVVLTSHKHPMLRKNSLNFEKLLTTVGILQQATGTKQSAKAINELTQALKEHKNDNYSLEDIAHLISEFDPVTSFLDALKNSEHNSEYFYSIIEHMGRRGVLTKAQISKISNLYTDQNRSYKSAKDAIHEIKARYTADQLYNSQSA